MKKIYTLLSAVCMGTTAMTQNTVYVDIDATGNNDGSNWNNAYNDLQDAIDNATAGDEVWIAEGTYYPTKDETGNSNPTIEQDKVFYWTNKELNIYGGFDGTETQLTQRDWENHPVILSGDIAVAGNFNDNVATVLKMELLSSSLLDGVTITNGKGVGIQTGGYYIANCSQVLIQNCEIAENHNTGQGGSSTSGSKVYFNNCDFNNNTASEGGSMYASNSTLLFSNCIFHHNSSTQHSGNITFNGSRNGEQNLFVNCLFHNNEAGSIAGGGLFFYNVAPGSLIYNCTFANNQAPNGSSVASNGADVEIRNSVFWSLNSVTEIYESNSNPGILDTQNSLVKGGYSTGTNIITTYPQFTDSANYDFTVLNNSPVIDLGDTTGISDYIPLVDLNGNSRYNGSIDLGCHESPISSVGVDETTKLASLIYPNPSNGLIHFDQSIDMINVFEINGKKVLSLAQPGGQIDLSHLPKGIYLIRLNNKDLCQTERFILE